MCSPKPTLAEFLVKVEFPLLYCLFLRLRSARFGRIQVILCHRKPAGDVRRVVRVLLGFENVKGEDGASALARAARLERLPRRTLSESLVQTNHLNTELLLYQSCSSCKIFHACAQDGWIVVWKATMHLSVAT